MRIGRRASRTRDDGVSPEFREWQRIRPEFDSPLWRAPEKGPAARMDEAAEEGRASDSRLRGDGQRA